MINECWATKETQQPGRTHVFHSKRTDYSQYLTMAFTTLTPLNNQLHVILYLIVTSSLLGYVATWDTHDVILDNSDTTRLDVEKDVLKHSITYLKSKLVKCLRETEHHRHKRKLHLHMEDLVMYQVDMEVLQNTKDYLVQRIVQCRRRGRSSPNDVVLERGAPVGNQQYHPNFIQTLNDKALTTLPPTTTTTKASEEPSTKVSTTTSTPLKAHPKSWGKPKTFYLSGRRVSCDNMEITGNKAVLTCRNLLVDGKHRLPNYDVCPEVAFNQMWWRHLNEIQARTFDVLDLKSFCTALGSASAIPMPVLDVKVNWSCGETKHRLKWLNGKWAGQVADNGYLHDIECIYYSIT